MSQPAAEAPILIAYDGSAHARAAVAQAGRLLGGPAVIVSVWQSVRPAGGMALAGLSEDVARDAIAALDQAAEDEARACAEEGARLAAAAGLDATPRAVQSTGSIWGTIVDMADEEDARAVVLGSRGRSAISAALMGSVSHGVAQHCRRPVLVVTAPEAGDGAAGPAPASGGGRDV
ncbi:MAG TPA: universal stress protein [Solirubrobacterales bacterium]|nr:universal stress protein [Solirubrobacterales bacterium]